MKRKEAKKKKPRTPSLKKLKGELWELCKQITRKRYRRDDGKWECFSCGSIMEEPWKVHTGHMIPSATCGMYLRYDLRNLRPQCYHCNINLGGNGALYLKHMLEEVGKRRVEKIFSDKNREVPSIQTSSFITKKIRAYKNILAK